MSLWAFPRPRRTPTRLPTVCPLWGALPQSPFRLKILVGPIRARQDFNPPADPHQVCPTVCPHCGTLPLTLCLLCVYFMFTSCLLYAYFVLTLCLLYAYFMLTLCLLCAYFMLTWSLLCAYFVLTLCLLCAYFMLTLLHCHIPCIPCTASFYEGFGPRMAGIAFCEGFGPDGRDCIL